MTTPQQFSRNYLPFYTLRDDRYKKPVNCRSLPGSNIAYFGQRNFKLRVSEERWSFLGVGTGKDMVLVEKEEWKRKRRMVLVRGTRGSGFKGENRRDGESGDDGDDISITFNLFNAACYIGFIYLLVTGKIGFGLIFGAVGWFWDLLISLMYLVVPFSILILGYLLWLVGGDIVKSTCPNCGNEFQIFKSALKDESQMCPFCGQPFSVVNGEDSSSAAIDVGAEIKDVD